MNGMVYSTNFYSNFEFSSKVDFHFNNGDFCMGGSFPFRYYAFNFP